MGLASVTGESEILGLSLAAALPIVVLALAFVVYCWIDIAKHNVKQLPKWAWAIICLVSVPLGGILYLTIGRDPDES